MVFDCIELIYMELKEAIGGQFPDLRFVLVSLNGIYASSYRRIRMLDILTFQEVSTELHTKLLTKSSNRLEMLPHPQIVFVDLR